MTGYRCPCSGTEPLLLWTGRLYKSGLDRDFNAVACRRCGLVSLYPPPTAQEMAQKVATQGWEAVHLPQRRRPLWPTLRQAGHAFLASLVQEHIPAGGTVLDIGCGNGEFGARLLAAGYEVTGLEPGPRVGQEAAARGLEIVASTVEDWDPAGRTFQAVILSHCLEHLSDPLAALRGAGKLLAPGGRLFIDVPNMERQSNSWRRSFAPQHRWYFCPASLRHLLGLAGLETIHERVFARDSFQIVARPLPAGRIPAPPDPAAACRIQAALRRHRWAYYLFLHFVWRKIPGVRNLLAFGRRTDRRYDLPEVG